MTFDYAKAFKAIEENKYKLGLPEFMEKVIERCKSLEVNPAWDAFLNLDYVAEVSLLKNHVVSVLKAEPAKFIEQGIWFGINNPILENGETSAGIYFSVSSTYDPNDEDADWACNAEHYPDERYFNSQIMRQIYRLAYSESDLGNKAEYTLCIAYGLKLAQAAIEEYKKLHPEQKIGYAVGFDSGDFINTGWV